MSESEIAERPAKEWTTDTLGAICRSGGGSIQTGPFGSQLHAEDYKEDGTPIITVEHLKEGKIAHENLPLVGKEDCRRLQRYKLSTGDLVFSRVGAIDRCALVSDAENGWLFSGRCLRVRAGNGEADSRFLSYLLNSFHQRQWILNHSVGSTMACLNTAILSGVPIAHPALPQQRKIARILTTVDNLIEKTEALIAKYQAIKQGMMHDLFTRGVDEHGHLRPPYEEAPELYKQSELGWIPKEWEARKLGDFTVIVRGSSPRPKGDPRYYGGTVPRLMVEDVTRDGKFVVPQVDFLTDAGAALSRPMPTGSLTLVCSGTVGVPAFLAVNACIHDGFLGFRQIGDCCSTDYLYHQFVFLKERMDTIATHGGIFTNLTTGIVKEFQIALPPRHEQEAISENLSVCDRDIAGEATALSKHKHYKTGLMQDLLTGKVRVKVDSPFMPKFDVDVEMRGHWGVVLDLKGPCPTGRYRLTSIAGTSLGNWEAPNGHVVSDKVKFAAYYPPTVAPGTSIVLEIVAYLEDQLDQVRALVREGSVVAGRKSSVSIKRNSDITILVHCPGLKIDDPRNVIEWVGEPANCQFIVQVPKSAKKREYHGTARIIVSGVERARFVFTVRLDGRATSPVAENLPRDFTPVRPTKTMFASYASEDRPEVLSWRRGAESADAKVFVDVMSLRQGENWKQRIEAEILRSDLFCLFWSEAASKSGEVSKEWQFALSAKGCDFIHPVPLVDPRKVPPPSRLGECAHFNDVGRIVLEYERFWRASHEEKNE